MADQQAQTSILDLFVSGINAAKGLVVDGANTLFGLQQQKLQLEQQKATNAAALAKLNAETAAADAQAAADRAAAEAAAQNPNATGTAKFLSNNKYLLGSVVLITAVGLYVFGGKGKKG